MRLHVFFVVLIALTISHPTLADVQITEVDDIDFGTWTGQLGSLNETDDICIFSDSGLYNVTAAGSGPGGRFRVFNGPEFMNYTVRWNDVPSTTSGQVKLNRNVALTGQSGADTVSNDCSSGASPTAHIQLRIGQNQRIGKSPGTYTGTLTLTIGAE